MPGVFETLQEIQFGLCIEMEENLNQIIKDLLQHVQLLGLQYVGDRKILLSLLHFKMIPNGVENELERNRIAGSMTSFKT